MTYIFYYPEHVVPVLTSQWNEYSLRIVVIKCVKHLATEYVSFFKQCRYFRSTIFSDASRYTHVVPCKYTKNPVFPMI